MLHFVIYQVAQIGGEVMLALLLAASIVSVAIISNRVLFFARGKIDADLFARQLLQLAAAEDWPRARALAQRSNASISRVTAAGLTQVARGRRAVRVALRSATLRESQRLEGQLGLLDAVAHSTLLVGLVGTLFDLLRLAPEPAFRAAAMGAKNIEGLDAIHILGPVAAGVFIAIPALLAASLLKDRVRITLRQIDSLSLLLLLQMEPAKGCALKQARKKHRKPLSEFFNRIAIAQTH